MAWQKNFLTHLTKTDNNIPAESRIINLQDHSQIQTQRLKRILSWFLPNGGTVLLIVALMLTRNVWASPMIAPVEPGLSVTTINYQGRLTDFNGNPLNGGYEMSFSLWDAPNGGSLAWGPEIYTSIPVNEGLFNVGLGDQTAGGIPVSVWDDDRYLEISVGGETLSPRVLIRGVPIAEIALTVPDAAIGTDQIMDGGVESDDLKLDYGTICLPEEATEVELPGDAALDIPGLSLDFSLSNPAQVLVWIDGLAMFNQADGQHNIILYVDDEPETSVFRHDANWFDINGQRIISLDAGSHSISAKASSTSPGVMTVHGSSHSRTCINYLVLGQ